MEYTYKDGKIYQDDTEVYEVKANSSNLGAKSIEITSTSGLQNVYIDKAPGGYKISQGSMEMGTISRNLSMNYNGRNYSLSRPYQDGDSRKMDIKSDDSKVGTLTFGSGSLTGIYDFMNDEVPVVVYMSVMSPYIRTAYGNPSAQGTSAAQRRNMYRMPRIYAILSNVVFLIAIVLILFSSYLGIPADYDFLILILVIVFSFVIRSIGRRKYIEQHKNDDENGMNKNL
ncbi:MAG: hypothetical protein RE471_08135 [Ferroplasma sp.]|uniref:hypothetical protein n=1 Tax=Ferroplasma sp. TaxID=2591003 RepID=UPI002814C463|nr:hypothetical protein [Ferroplasma sp.]WMT50936.1 MAG: hypothetical protein RE471_08135 [Ferroplasma sp.]